MRTPGLVPLILAAALAVAAPLRSRADEPVAPDSSLGGFLEQLSDSTDSYFGLSATPVDTAGLDTVLFDTSRPRRRLDFGLLPSYTFNRVDGSTPGLVGSVSGAPVEERHTGLGTLTGSLARANGPRVVLGGMRYTNRLWLAGQPFDISLWGGRATASMDVDLEPDFFGMLRALFTGNDWTQYCRRDGFDGSLTHERAAWRVRAGWRDVLQSPLRTTTGWNLTNQPLEMPSNLAADPGRAREARFSADLRWPRIPLRTEVEYRSSSRALGSDFEYRRWRAAAGLDLTLGRVASLVPQIAYGRLTGEAVPQAAFYLGADATLRSLRRDERAGTALAVARVDLMGAQDLLATLRIPHPSALPLRGGLFAAASAAWGGDPYAGDRTVGGAAPDRRDWLSEAGVSLLYDSALFGPGGILVMSFAWPLGPDSPTARWSVSFTRVLDLLGPAPQEP